MPAVLSEGRVHAVRGAVIDVRFDAGTLPALNEALTPTSQLPSPTGNASLVEPVGKRMLGVNPKFAVLDTRL